MRAFTQQITVTLRIHRYSSEGIAQKPALSAQSSPALSLSSSSISQHHNENSHNRIVQSSQAVHDNQIVHNTQTVEKDVISSTKRPQVLSIPSRTNSQTPPESRLRAQPKTQLEIHSLTQRGTQLQTAMQSESQSEEQSEHQSEKQPENSDERRSRRKERSRNPFASRRSHSLASQRKKSTGRHWVQEYTLNIPYDATILDCLLYVKKYQDPSLSFRYSCTHGICGSDGVSINGIPSLLCKSLVKRYLKIPHRGISSLKSDDSTSDNPFIHVQSSEFRPTRNTTEKTDNTGNNTIGTTINSFQPAQNSENSPYFIDIAPLPGFPVLRDLIVDLNPMFKQIESLKPYLKHDNSHVNDNDFSGIVHSDSSSTASAQGISREYRQTPQELANYEILTNCISCGLCEGICPIYASGEAFIGSAALIQTSRFIHDSRDTVTDERISDISQPGGIGACQSVRACTRPCPQHIDVGEEIWKLINITSEHNP